MNIVITGEGIISAIGYDKATVLAALREKRTGIGQMRWLKSTHRELPVGMNLAITRKGTEHFHVPQVRTN